MVLDKTYDDNFVANLNLIFCCEISTLKVLATEDLELIVGRAIIRDKVSCVAIAAAILKFGAYLINLRDLTFHIDILAAVCSFLKLGCFLQDLSYCQRSTC